MPDSGIRLWKRPRAHRLGRSWVASARPSLRGRRIATSKHRAKEFALLARDVEDTEFAAWEIFVVFRRVVDSRWVLIWKVADGRAAVKARLAARGFQDPDLREHSVRAKGCVSLRYSHLQSVFGGAIKKWRLRSLDIENALLQTNDLRREVYLRAPSGKSPCASERTRELRAPAYGLNIE